LLLCPVCPARSAMVEIAPGLLQCQRCLRERGAYSPTCAYFAVETCSAHRVSGLRYVRTLSGRYFVEEVAWATTEWGFTDDFRVLSRTEVPEVELVLHPLPVVLGFPHPASMPGDEYRLLVSDLAGLRFQSPYGLKEVDLSAERGGTS